RVEIETSVRVDAIRRGPEMQEPYSKLGAQRFAIAVAIGFAAGAVIVLMPYGIAWLFKNASGPYRPEYTFSILALFPFVQGLAAALAMGPKRYSPAATVVVVSALFALEIVAAVFVVREGIICIIMAAPFIAALASIGALLGRVLAHVRLRREVQASLVP